MLHNCWERAAELWPYVGPAPTKGWGDSGMLVGGANRPGMTEAQTRTQFAMKVILPEQLMLGLDIRNTSQFMKATLLNKEAIAINQDAAGHAGRRWLKTGSDRQPIPAAAFAPSLAPCDPPGKVAKPQQWSLNASGHQLGTITNAAGTGGRVCFYMFGNPVPKGSTATMWKCVPHDAAANAVWRFDAASGQLRSELGSTFFGGCLTAPTLTIESCGEPGSAAAAGQRWAYDVATEQLKTTGGGGGSAGVSGAQGQQRCLSSQPPKSADSKATQVWGRRLGNGSVAMVATNWCVISCVEARWPPKWNILAR